MNPPVPAAGRLDETLSRRLRQLESAARRVRKRADPEAVHDVRVATRRLEAGLDLWRDVLPPAAWRRARRGLRAWRRDLGKAREARIGELLLRERIAQREFDAAMEAVLGEMVERRIDLEKRAARRASRARLRRVTRRFERAWRLLDEMLPHPHDRVVAARPRVERQAAIMRSLIARARGAWADDALHRARIGVKRSRYASEWAQALGETPDRTMRAIRRVQEDLGHIHDLAILRSRLARIARKRVAVSETPDRLADMIASLELERADRVRRLHGLLEGPSWRGPALRLATPRAASS